MKYNKAEMAEKAPYMEAFVASACDVIKTMAMKDAVCGNICMLPKEGISCEIGAIIELSGSNRGATGLAMGRDLAREIVAGITGKPDKELTLAEIRNDVLELINMTAGGAKSRLSGTPWHFTLSIPRDCSGEMFSPALFPGAAAMTAELKVGGRSLTLITGLSHGT